MSAAVFAASFAALYASHQVGDHIAQTHAQSLGKAADKGWLVPMLGHLATYTSCQLVALAALAFVGAPIGFWPGAAGIAFSVLTHGFIDRRWPVRWLLEHTGSREFAQLAGCGINGMYLADQSLHCAMIFVAALIMGGFA